MWVLFICVFALSAHLLCDSFDKKMHVNFHFPPIPSSGHLSSLRLNGWNGSQPPLLTPQGSQHLTQSPAFHFLLDQHHAACIQPHPRLLASFVFQHSLFPARPQSRPANQEAPRRPLDPSAKAPGPHPCQNKEARSIVARRGRR